MDRKILEGLWDCHYCNTKGIRGSVYKCPNCGHTRDADVQFYLPEDAHEAEDKNTEQDWECQFCGSLNHNEMTACPNCGHSRDESDKKYFETAKKKKEQEAPAAPPPAPRKTSPLAILLPLGLILLLFILLFQSLKPRHYQAKVEDLQWEYTTYMEEYREEQESGWTLPEDATLVRTQQEVRSYDQVLMGYETRTRTVYETVTEYETVTTTHDLGNGNFEQVTEQVPKYVTVPREETYQEPVYQSVPVYGTKYYYNIYRWRSVEPVVTRGGPDRAPYFMDPVKSDNIRTTGQSENYIVVVSHEDKIDTFTIDSDQYFKLKVGETYNVTIQNGAIQFDDL